MNALSKSEIVAVLRQRGWRNRKDIWFNKRIPERTDLQGAARLEVLESTESLVERSRRFKSPTIAQYRAAEAELALSRANITTCARCGWPVWQDESCRRCGHRTR